VLSTRTQNGHLHVSGLPPGQPWRIYSITDMLVRHSTADADEATVSLPSRGIYIVQSGECSIKVAY
jgi:hypothetical protein